MTQLVSFEVADYLNNNGIIIDSKYCYCRSKVGVRVVKSDNKGNDLSERTYHRGTIELVDSSWGIEYPSENWCSAPAIFDVVKYFDETLNIVVIPLYKGNRLFNFSIYKFDNLIYTDEIDYYSLTAVYKAGIEYYTKIYESQS